MQHFRKTTNGKIVVMGRKTYESIGKPLPNRKNIVLSKKQKCDIKYVNDDVEVYTDFKKIISDYKNEDIYVIGGKMIYELFFKYANVLIISKIFGEYKCDEFINFNLKDFYCFKREQYDTFVVEYYRRIENE
jgi:dihydrofolate reductase